MTDRFAGEGLRNPAGLRPVRDPAEELRRRGFRVGEWDVEPRLNQIRRGDVERRLDPRVTDMLVHLAARSGDVLTRDELLEAVWGCTFVAENTLSQTVSRLRKALDDDWQSPRYIETIAKSGYRLIAPVEVEETATAAAAATPVPTPAPPSTVSTVPGRAPVTGLSVALRLGFAAVALVIALGGWFWLSRMPTQAPPTPPPIAVPEITLPGVQIDPAISPDGTRIAFAWQDPEREGVDVYVKQIGSEALLRLTDGPGNAARIAWSEDGLHLAHLRADGDSCGLFRMAAIGGHADRVGDCMDGMRHLEWSPDGARIAFSAKATRESPRGLFAVDVATGVTEQLVPAPTTGGGDKDPAFSPDGRWLAFVRMPLSARHEVWIANADGSAPRRLTNDRWGRIRGIDWSADGPSVVFSSNRNGRFALWRIAPEGGKPLRLPIQDEWVTEPSIAGSAAPGRVIYKNFADVTDIWRLELASDGTAAGAPDKRVASSRSELYPARSPDGTAVAFTSDRTGTFEVWSASLDGSASMRHTAFGGPRPSSPRFSPDGSQIVFDADADGHADVWHVARDSRQPRRLTRSTADDRNAVFSRDGKTIYFASDRDGGWQIWALDASGGAPRRVTDDGGFLAQEGPLGEYLYWVRLDEPGIWRRPIAGGASTLVLPELSLDNWASWQVTRRGIWYVRHNPTAILLRRFGDDATVEVHATAKQVPYLGRSLSVAADESFMLFGMIDHSDDEILRVDLPQ